MRTVSVIGGSNGGYAAAGDFADRGFDVQWYVRSPGSHRRVLADEQVRLRVSENYLGRRTPGETRAVDLDLVTADLAEAVGGADCVVVPLPTTAQESLSGAVAPVLEDGQTVFLCPGNGGSIIFRRAIDDLSAPPEDVVVAETPTLPYVTRRSGPAEVTINLDAVHLPVGAFPGNETGDAHDVFSTLYDVAIPAADALDAALNNSNVGVNALPTVINAGAIDCGEFRFNVHRHGVTERTLEAVLAVDEERIRIREALGYDGPHFPQEAYYRPGPGTGEHFYGASAREALMAADTFSEDPPSLDDRYIHEDVRIAGVLQASLGATLDLETPTLDSLLHLAETVMEEPYRETGRNLARLGLPESSRERLHAVLERGFEA